VTETPDAFLRRYAANTDAHRLAATLALIADDAVYLFSDGTAHIGKAAIAEVLRHNFATIADETYRIHDIRWLLGTDDATACVYVFEWTGMVDGKPASGSGRGTSVLRRDGEGWLVVHEHLSRGGLG
jgi:ketosteroid isomerase-like protein